MKRTKAEQLESLDNFQRAEFLYKKRLRSEYVSRLHAIREQTAALYQKRSADIEYFKKLQTRSVGLILAAFALEAIIGLMPIGSGSVLFLTLLFGSQVLGHHAAKVNDNHNELMFQILTLEAQRCESEFRINGLEVTDYFDGDDERATREILESLGFDGGLIGSVSKSFPLMARD